VSTILKALRRLEQERSKGAERPLREQVVLSQARGPRSWPAWLAAGTALALGFAATWAALTNLGEPAAPPGALSTPPVATAPPPRASGSPTPIGVASAPEPAPRVAAPPRPAPPAPRAAAPPRVAPAPAPARAIEPAPRPVVPTPQAVAVAPAPARSRLPEPAVEPDEEPVLTAPIGRVPRLVEEEPRASARSALPVSVVRTSWHPQADRRAAWVAVGGESAREVREGEWVGAYEVRTIEPDGVLFADGPLLVHRSVGQR
jgi:hypothetical protein